MKIVIALVCLVAFAAAVEETGQIDVDLDGAEHRHGGGHGGGYGGGFGGGRGGYGGGGGHHGGRFGRSPQKPIFRPHPTPRPSFGRKGRSVDEILEPVAVQIADQDVAEQYWSPYVNPVDQVAISADQDVAEQRYGGHGGGRGGHGGGRRYGRSLEEAQPFIVAEFQPEYVDYVSDDLQLAENRNYGGYGGNGNHGSGGYRGRRSVEDENAVAIEDLEVAENRGGSYNRGHSSGGSGYGHSGSYSNRGSSGGSGYGGQHRGRRSVQEIAGAIEDLEVAEHHNKGYNRGGSSGGSDYGNHGSSSGYGRPSGGHGSHSGHGGR